MVEDVVKDEENKEGKEVKEEEDIEDKEGKESCGGGWEEEREEAGEEEMF